MDTGIATQISPAQHLAKHLPCFEQPLQGCQPRTALIPVACGQADLQAYTSCQYRSEQHAARDMATNMTQPHSVPENSNHANTCSKKGDNVVVEVLYAGSSFGGKG